MIPNEVYPIFSILLSIGALVLLIIVFIKLNKKGNKKHILNTATNENISDLCVKICGCDLAEWGCRQCWAACWTREVLKSL